MDTNEQLTHAQHELNVEAVSWALTHDGWLHIEDQSLRDKILNYLKAHKAHHGKQVPEISAMIKEHREIRDEYATFSQENDQKEA